MDPAVKTAMALCVLLAGVCAAMLFRRDPAATAPPGPPPEAAELLLIRQRAAAIGADLTGNRADRLTPLGQRPAGKSANPRAATVIAPSDRREPPPPLADSYPQGDRPANSRWGMSMDSVLPASLADETTRSHRIVDGDTLPALAERYLGSADRAREIFEANRNVLDNPELLPIGAELKIPPRSATPSNKSPLPPGEG
jgi:nucleoid-associated protein YgaU